MFILFVVIFPTKLVSSRLEFGCKSYCVSGFLVSGISLTGSSGIPPEVPLGHLCRRKFRWKFRVFYRSRSVTFCFEAFYLPELCRNLLGSSPELPVCFDRNFRLRFWSGRQRSDDRWSQAGRNFRPRARSSGHVSFFQFLAPQFSSVGWVPPELPASHRKFRPGVANAHNGQIWEPFKRGSSSPSWALSFLLGSWLSLSPPLSTLKKLSISLSPPMILASF